MRWRCAIRRLRDGALLTDSIGCSTDPVDWDHLSLWTDVAHSVNIDCALDIAWAVLWKAHLGSWQSASATRCGPPLDHCFARRKHLCCARSNICQHPASTWEHRGIHKDSRFRLVPWNPLGINLCKLFYARVDFLSKRPQWVNPLGLDCVLCGCNKLSKLLRGNLCASQGITVTLGPALADNLKPLPDVLARIQIDSHTSPLSR